jgi:hypothetical protein
MGKFIDLTGQRFGRVVALKPAGRNKQQNVIWSCICDCGKTAIVSQSNLVRALKGVNVSCGCFKKENARKLLTTHGLSKDELGKQSRLYGIWADMKRRCLNPDREEFQNYGGRGIGFCEGWSEYKPFYEWAMANGYRDDLTLERRDNNKGYSPDNCKWATMKEQKNNTRRNHLITYDGRTMTLTAWAGSLGMKVNTLWLRIKKGWPIEKVLTRRVIL